jgi:hypothetical protein
MPFPLENLVSPPNASSVFWKASPPLEKMKSFQKRNQSAENDISDLVTHLSKNKTPNVTILPSLLIYF